MSILKTSRLKPVFRSACTCMLALSLLAPAPAFASAYEMGLRLYQEGQYESATQYFRRAVQENTTDPNVRYYLADSLLKTGRLQEAQQEYQTILAMAPHSQAAKLSALGLSRLGGYVNKTGKTRLGRASGRDAASGPDEYTGPIDAGADYLEDVLDSGKYVRWSLSAMPLKVYIQPSPQGVRNFEPGFVTQMQRALDVWVKALNNQLSYQLVSFPNDADIRVTWTNSIDTRGHSTETGTSFTAGLTVPKINNGQLTAMEVTMATFDIQGHPHNPQDIYTVGIHEFGHALGLLGHSKSRQDVMYAQSASLVALSRQDLNTIRRLYAHAADIANTAPDLRKNAQREQELAGELDKSIAKMEALVKASDNNLNWLNLATTYFRKGKALPAGSSGKPEETPRYWFEKSVNSLNEALKREPDDPRAYYKRCLAFQELGRNEEALQDVERAIQLDGKAGDYHLQEAWILAKTGQKARAKNALDQYLILAPTEAKSEEVRQIQDKLSRM